MGVHGDGCEKALAALVAGTAIDEVTTAHAGHAPAEGVAITLVALKDLVLCLVVRVTVFNITVGGH